SMGISFRFVGHAPLSLRTASISRANDFAYDLAFLSPPSTSIMKTTALRNKDIAPSAIITGQRIFQFSAIYDTEGITIERVKAIIASNGKLTGRTPLPITSPKRIVQLIPKLMIVDATGNRGIINFMRCSTIYA